MNKKTGLVAFFLLVVTCVFSQGTTPEEIKNYFWNNEDNHNELTKAPEKWANESAVILYKNMNYGYHKSGKKVTYKSSIRKRIILLDKNAVEAFSKFSFRKSFFSDKGYSRKSAQVFLGVKIIKPDGEVLEINVDKDAVVRDDKYKLAIPNLEVGDIIDYYFYTIEPFVSQYEYIFDPVERTLAEEYPIVSLIINLESEKGFFINFKSINGAPQLKEIPTEDKKTRSYVLEATAIEKSETKKWHYPLLDMPAIKMQVYFARNGNFKNRTTAFLPRDENIIKSSVSKSEIIALYNKRLEAKGSIIGVNQFIKGKTFKSNEEVVTTIYYYMRHHYLNRYLEAIYAKKAEISKHPFEYYKTDMVYIDNEKEFINIFSNLLRKLEIPFEVIIATKRYNGKIEDLLIEENVNVLIKVNTPNPLYVTAFQPHTPISYINPYLEGSDVYLLSRSKKELTTFDVIEKGTLPVSKSTDNVMTKMINLKLKPDFVGFDVAIMTLSKGHMKIADQEDKFTFSDYIYKEYEKYDTRPFAQRIPGMKKVKDKVANEMNALALKKKNDIKEESEAQIKSDLGLAEINNYSFEIKKNGRYSLNSYFVYAEQFDFDTNFIKKAGSNYIIEIGKFIGEQIEIKEKERKRDVDIYMQSPRIYNYKITLAIPDGYTIMGIDKLQKNVKNNTGAFISKAKIVGNSLVIETTKQYKYNYYTKDKWEDILAFLDEANQFRNEKILLKKQ